MSLFWEIANLNFIMTAAISINSVAHKVTLQLIKLTIPMYVCDSSATNTPATWFGEIPHNDKLLGPR